MLRYAIRLSVIAIAFGASAGFVTAPAYAQEQRFAVKGIVVDPTGAVIQQAEIVFKRESGTIVAHTGMDGSVSVNLEAGKYLVTISAFGFASAKLAEFSVPDPGADVFRVSLKIDQSQMNYGSDFGQSGIVHVPTVPSELSEMIKAEPTRTSLPVLQPETVKHRSLHCLYLWRCSASQP